MSRSLALSGSGLGEMEGDSLKNVRGPWTQFSDKDVTRAPYWLIFPLQKPHWVLPTQMEGRKHQACSTFRDIWDLFCYKHVQQLSVTRIVQLMDAFIIIFRFFKLSYLFVYMLLLHLLRLLGLFLQSLKVAVRSFPFLKYYSVMWLWI